MNAYDGGVAFAKKDYDTFLSLANKNWDQLQSASTAMSVASALDCKYAITGDPQYRQHSEDMMARARQMAAGDKEIMAELTEFEDRHNYRLRTRQIITKSEYDQKFRSIKETAQHK